METNIFNALAEPNRLHIVELLRERPYSVNEIAEQLQLRQPQVSKHLRYLSEVGLVMVYPIAQQRFYGIRPEPLKELDDWIGSFERFWDSKFSILDRYLETLKEKQAMATSAKRPPLTIEHIFNAPRDLVWEAWTDPKHLAQWWAPEYFSVSEIEVDARPGGVRRIDMQAPDGTIYPTTGMFKEVTKPERLVFNSTPLDAAGNKLFEVQQTLVFSEIGDTTKLVLEARVLSATPEAAPYLAGMEPGIQQSLAKLDRLLVDKSTTKRAPM
jgi:uncharacterized protein YndB with AHSA1/START domain/DNA-binding transcriptional ArsR family regulator